MKRYFLRKIGTGTYLVNCIFRYIFRINVGSPFPMHYTSRISVGKLLEIVADGDEMIFQRCLACSPAVYIQAKNGIRVHSSVYMAPGVKIISANHDFSDLKKHTQGREITIGRGVWLGANAIILPEVNIGDNSIVGAGSVVTKDVPENVVVAGNPARIIRSLADF